jgi:hypothetical protein
MKMEALSSQNVELKRERTRKSDFIKQICVAYVNRQPNDSVAFNDYHVGVDVQCVAFNDHFFPLQYEVNGAYEVTLIRIFIKLLKYRF